MADQSHAVGEKMDVIVQLRFVQHAVGGGIDLAAQHAGADRLHRRLLDGFDLGQQIDQFGIGLADDPHAREVADIAVIIAAGIERQHVALLPALVRRRAVEARSRRDQAIIEGQPARGFLAAQRLGQFGLGGAGAVVLESPPASS